MLQCATIHVPVFRDIQYASEIRRIDVYPESRLLGIRIVRWQQVDLNLVVSNGKRNQLYPGNPGEVIEDRLVIHEVDEKPGMVSAAPSGIAIRVLLRYHQALCPELPDELSEFLHARFRQQLDRRGNPDPGRDIFRIICSITEALVEHVQLWSGLEEAGVQIRRRVEHGFERQSVIDPRRCDSEVSDKAVESARQIRVTQRRLIVMPGLLLPIDAHLADTYSRPACASYQSCINRAFFAGGNAFEYTPRANVPAGSSIPVPAMRSAAINFTELALTWPYP